MKKKPRQMNAKVKKITLGSKRTLARGILLASAFTKSSLSLSSLRFKLEKKFRQNTRGLKKN